MREILFRGLTDDSVQPQKWVYGNYNYSKFDGHDISQNISEIEGATYRIIPETLGQYIGLKDSNNIKMVDGDIVRTIFTNTNGDEKVETRQVAWDGVNPCFVLETYPEIKAGYGEYDFVQVWMRVNEIIGNIHDNI